MVYSLWSCPMHRTCNHGYLLSSVVHVCIGTRYVPHTHTHAHAHIHTHT